MNESPRIKELEPENQAATAPLYRLTKINLLQFLLFFAIIPFVFYWLIWIPHIRLNPEFGFIDVQRQILVYHENVGSGMDIHPYCSTWYSWILMLRPVAYFYQVANSVTERIPVNSKLTLAPGRVVYDVHAMGNPFLWWFSSAAIALLAWIVIDRWKQLPSLASVRNSLVNSAIAQDLWIGLFLLTSYLANLLPWVRVTRCVFLYHYMGASVYALMALAWFVDRWFRNREYRVFAISTLLIIAGAFIFWMPIYLGLPLTEAQYQMRMWFRSWI